MANIDFKNSVLCILVDGGWGQWGSWSSCYGDCGSEVKKSYRRCNQPEPKHNGAACAGKASKLETCNSPGCQGISIPNHRTNNAIIVFVVLQSHVDHTAMYNFDFRL